MRKLPFLNGIRAFEAAARAESFAKAARRTARHAGRDQPDGAASRAASRRAAVRAQGQPARADSGGPRLSNRPDAGLRSARQSDGANHGDGGLACADCRRRADLRDALAHSAARRFPEGGAGGRGALRHRRRDVALQRRLDLRHPARRRRLAGFYSGAFVRRRFHAGLLARDGEAAEVAGRFAECNAAARRARGGRMAALVQDRRAVKDPREGTGVRILRPGFAGRCRRRRRCDRHQPLCRRRPQGRAGWWRRSRSRCQRASTGI